jgi:hypothetical protein
MWLHVDREADPQVPTFGSRARLLGAEGVVPDLRRRLLERLLGRDVLDRHAAGRLVGEVGPVEDVAAPELERVEPEFAVYSIICSRAVVSIIHGPRYEADPHVLV